MHATCATRVYETLIRGRDLTVGQVIEAAKAECEVLNRENKLYGHPVSVLIDKGFEEICYTWIKKGVAFVYYIQYLYQKMMDHTVTLDKFTIIIDGDGNVVNTGNQNQLNINNSIKKNDEDDRDFEEP